MHVILAFIIFAVITAAVGHYKPQDITSLPLQANLSQTEQVITQTETSTNEVSSVQPVVQSTTQNTVTQNTNTTVTPQTTTKKVSTVKSTVSNIVLDTYIQAAPLTNEVLKDTKVIFEFAGSVTPKSLEKQIIYETKILGFDSVWKESYSNQRIVDLPGGVTEYTFLVRAKVNNVVDATPAQRTFRVNVSPYFNKVKISNVRIPNYFGASSLITLETNLTSKGAIDITGWEIKGKRGGIVISKGVKRYNPSITPLSTGDIILRQGDIVYISSEENPIKGSDSNFRVNKCMAYLPNSDQYPIPIQKNCQKIEVINIDKIPQTLGSCCKEYLSGLGNCNLPTFEGMKAYGIDKNQDCYNYINDNYTYSSCYSRNSQDSDFLESKWNIYTNSKNNEIMDVNADTIYVFDQNDLLVAKLSYGCEEGCVR